MVDHPDRSVVHADDDHDGRKGNRDRAANRRSGPPQRPPPAARPVGGATGTRGATGVLGHRREAVGDARVERAGEVGIDRRAIVGEQHRQLCQFGVHRVDAEAEEGGVDRLELVEDFGVRREPVRLAH